MRPASTSSEDYRRTSDKKREDTWNGRQFSRQPADIPQETAPYRHQHEASKAELMEQARRRGVPGRSRMDKEALRRALEP